MCNLPGHRGGLRCAGCSLYNSQTARFGPDNVIKTVTLNLSTEALNGTWKLRVNDNAAGDTGYINSWSVTF